ncbi:hypothetical protein SKAU_G00031160 [Synaphobranchus kaupii]|uniref:Uncharacterized protein n=1 Tax=Synaphobranchus kaupii TaxID=118154 RepID=A0A9Q1GEY6_SYNKA|nr:hypothetical protein SKAU_G00031160 [Synaphobranchus kaupii]
MGDTTLGIYKGFVEDKLNRDTIRELIRAFAETHTGPDLDTPITADELLEHGHIKNFVAQYPANALNLQTMDGHPDPYPQQDEGPCKDNTWKKNPKEVGGGRGPPELRRLLGGPESHSVPAYRMAGRAEMPVRKAPHLETEHQTEIQKYMGPPATSGIRVATILTYISGDRN